MGIDVGVDDLRAIFGTVGGGGDEMWVVDHVEVGVVSGDVYARIAGIV